MVGENSAKNKMATFIERVYPLGFRKDAMILIKMAIPFAISYVLSSSTITIVSLAFMAHLGQEELNASSLANTIFLLICYALMLGLNFGCDTLLPQFFGGNKRKVGLIWQRGMLIAVYACFVSWILMLNAVNNMSKSQDNIIYHKNFIYKNLSSVRSIEYAILETKKTKSTLEHKVSLKHEGNIQRLSILYLCLYI
jgi:Na+-driven multidrug efflux pump